MQNKSPLSEFKLNSLFNLKNHIVMAPMTRCKSSDDFVPTPDMAQYYGRRASVGLIVTEGTIIRPDACGYANVPGIFNQAQIDGWKRVTDEVHAHDGLIFSQIWHVGRVSHPHFLHGELPISPSETEMKGHVSRTDGLTYGRSRALAVSEISELVASYAQAAKNAMAAGFDGIEIHGANGYLIDQFLHYHTNLRQDEYGGSPKNMVRFALEIIKACGEAIGYERVGLRLSPVGYLNDVQPCAKDTAVFQYLLNELNSLPIAYLHTGNFNDDVVYAELGDMTMSGFLRANFKGVLIACGGYTVEQATSAINKQEFDLIAFGRPLIANHDLVEKIKTNTAFAEYHRDMLAKLV